MQQYRQRVSPGYPAPKLKPHRKTKLVITLLSVVVVAAVMSWATETLLPPLQSKAHGAALAGVVPARKPTPVNRTLLATQINKAINNSSLEIGVSIIDATSDTHYNYGLGSTDYIAASTTKLLSATLFLRDVEQSQYKLGDPLGDSSAQNELQKMIIDSDNDAWTDFNDLLGHPALLQYAHGLGMNTYNPDTNTIASDDLALLLDRLYQGKLLNGQDTKLLLSYMKQADYTQYILAAIPNGVQVYHKAGYLDDRAMDAAIIDNGKHPYVLVIFTKDPSGNGYDQAAGQQAFHDITTATLTAFAR
jgi:beta-lactamase class A